MEMKNKYVVEYSVSQDCFHVCTLEESLKLNFENAKLKKSNDYQILYIGGYEECSIYAENFREVYHNE